MSRQMNTEQERPIDRYYNWIKDEADNLLTAMGYDVTKDIHQQFLERMKPKLDGTKPKRGRRRKKIDLPPTKV